jgi:hypothetical protein
MADSDALDAAHQYDNLAKVDRVEAQLMSCMRDLCEELRETIEQRDALAIVVRETLLASRDEERTCVNEAAMRAALAKCGISVP